MKIIAMTAAGLLAASALTPAPAEARDRGWNGHRGPPGGWRGGHHRDWRRHPGPVYHGYRGPRGYGYGYRYRGRSRVVCHVVRGYYGPVRRCFTVRR